MRDLKIQLAIALSVWTLWLTLNGPSVAINSFLEHVTVALTMLLGSFVAGSTSVGGGAVAFPVFTKLLQIDSETALIFSLAIQSVGMTAASLFIFLSKVPVCLRLIRYSVVIGGLGLLASFFIFRLHIAAADIKYLFSCFSFMVGAAMLWSHFRDLDPAPLSNSGAASNAITTEEYSCSGELKAGGLLLVSGCFTGGMLSGIIGTGIDFVLFSLMIFYWRYDFKKAIATSVVIMAVNASVGFIAILLATNLFTGEVVSYWLAAVPIVVVGAPLGAFACRHIPKSIMVFFLLLLISADILSTIFILGFRADFIGTLFAIFLVIIAYETAQRRKPLTNQTD